MEISHPRTEEHVSNYGIGLEDLRTLSLERDPVTLVNIGGIGALAEALKTSLEEGLPAEEAESGYLERKNEFGENTYPDPPRDSFFDMLVEAAKDTTIIILACLAGASLALALIFGESGGWIEPVAIMIAVVLVTFVTAGNNYSKELQFRKLSKIKEDKPVKVVRAGVDKTISIFDVCAGELILLEAGDTVPADGLFVDGFNLEIDESNMTGETDMVKKTSNAPFMISGCQVNDGYGHMIALGVGENSEWGMTVAKLQTPPQETPLQQKLDVLAAQIGKFGLAVAILVFLVLSLYLVIDNTKNDKWSTDSLSKFTHFFLIAVTIVVVAVPEGLPLAVTISLAYSMKKMMEDNNLVRHLSACETMGGATNICSDKTGTLTENRMKVTEGWFANVKYPSVPDVDKLGAPFVENLALGIAVNSKANVTYTEEGQSVFQGNKTECALLDMCVKGFHRDYHHFRVEQKPLIRQVYTFSSARKRMSTLLRVEHGADEFVLFCKGAAEIVLSMCSHYASESGVELPMSDEKRAELNTVIEDMARRGLRTICLARRDFSEDGGDAWEDMENTPEVDMTVMAIVGIKDPLRKEVYGAVAQCARSGITVRMVTGDNPLTAEHIARECGILTDGIYLDGKTFRNMDPVERDKILPRLQVLARSTPSDKFILVNRLRALGEVVAVTGDGTNDAPALKEADVGLSMGLSGTEVAKEASDIVILDDNFASIVKAVLWGRSVFENIRKFLQFQMTVNVVALVVTLVAALAQRNLPLTAVQLLWVNLIMDTFAALALATEPPHPSLLDRKPYGRFDPLITSIMIRNVAGQSIFQLAVLLTLLFVGQDIFSTDAQSMHHNTIIFNTFVMCQLFNEINSRKINDENNIFENIFKSSLFMIIWFLTIVVQVLIVTFGGSFTQTYPISFVEWLACIGIGAVGIPVGFLVRLVPVKPRKPNIPKEVREAQEHFRNAQLPEQPGDTEMHQPILE